MAVTALKARPGILLADCALRGAGDVTFDASLALYTPGGGVFTVEDDALAERLTTDLRDETGTTVLVTTTVPDPVTGGDLDSAVPLGSWGQREDRAYRRRGL